MRTRFFSTRSQRQESKRRAKRPIITFFKPEGALTSLKMLHLTSQARLPFRGLLRSCHKSFRVLHSLVIFRMNHSRYIMERIQVFESSINGFNCARATSNWTLVINLSSAITTPEVVSELPE